MSLVIPEEALEQFLAGRGWSLRGLMRGDYELTLDEVQTHILTEDPVVFAESMLWERDADEPTLWRLFDYQKGSMRYRGDTVHQCGAEVGKSREITALTLWRTTTRRGDVLIAAAQEGHLDEVWEEIAFQREASPWIEAQFNPKGTKVKPYRSHRLRNGNRILFRPCGNDGTALKSLHISGTIFLDEAASVRNRKVFGNFFSRAKPGCESRVYAVPDGDRTSPYFELTEESVAVDVFRPVAVPGKRAKFIWPKTLMPEPWWSPERQAKLARELGGVDSPEYRQNVMGEHGDPTSSVFPWPVFSQCLRYDPDYVAVKLTLQATDGLIYVDAYRLNQAYQVAAAGDESDEAAAGPEVPICREQVAFTPDALTTLIRRFFSPSEGRQLALGVDFGGSENPSELLLFEQTGLRRRVKGRLHLKRWPYPDQERAIRDLFDVVEPALGAGLDSTGVGVTVEQLLLEMREGRRYLGGEIGGYVFNNTVPEVGEDGEVLLDSRDRPRMVTLKELATRILELEIQQQTIEFPYDPDFMVAFPGHTARIGPSGQRIYSKKNDHLIDACRVAELRLRFLGEGAPVDLGGFQGTGVLTASASLREVY
ncbi:MAG TPA: hypothetical protein VF017_15475 [Thermoanaerobaculia bacterium]|nr:hypothetical protein [Thermoanaerobaculia bacterium]